MAENLDGLTNEELVKKAVITTNDMATAGKLPTEVADKFLDFVIDETVWTKIARVERFRSETWEVHKIGVGSRVAVPAIEATDPGIRRGANFSKVSLTPVQIMLPFEISRETQLVNIEGDTIAERIARLMAIQLGNDLEELSIRGNTLGPAAIESTIVPNGSTTQYVADSYLALHNGWLTQVRDGTGAHTVDHANANIGVTTLGNQYRTLPTKFRRNKKNLRWIASDDMVERWMERVSTRGTSLGDAALQGTQVTPLGIPMQSVPLFDDQPVWVEHITLNGTTATSLKFGPVSSVVVTPTTLGAIPSDAFSATTDYLLDATAGTVARRAGSTIGDGDTVKVTYAANPQMILTHPNNFIVGLGQDIEMDTDKDIFRRVKQYAMTVRIAFAVEEIDATVFGENFGTGI